MTDKPARQKSHSMFHGKTRKMSRKVRLLLYMAAAGFSVAVLGLLAVIGAYFYYAPTLPEAQELKTVKLQVPLRVYSRDGKLLAEYGEQRRVPVTLEQVPEQMKWAIIAAEDDRFYSHPGIDPVGMVRAAWQNLMAGEIVGGASTITQQVAKNFFLSFEQIWSRKIREIFLAIKIEQELSKDEILTLYLNKIYLGNRAYGVGAAAEIYYGKPLEELTLAQMAMIATLPKAPSRYNPIANPERALIRRAYVLGRMLELGYIEQAEYDEAMAAPVTAEYHGFTVELDAPYIGEMARAEALERFGEEAYSAGYRIYTSIDSRLQRVANDALENALQEYDARYGYRGPVDHVELDELELPAPPAEGKDESGNVPEPTDAERAARSRLDGVLENVDEPGKLTAALVLEVDEDSARIWRREKGQAELTMAGLAWARPEGEDGQLGPAPQQPADVLQAGDIIYVMPAPADVEGENDNPSGLRLAQEPEVQGAIISLDPDDGAIRALVGGYDFYSSKFNRATQAQRQPGSSFKPFVYSAALANGFTPATIVNDAPVVFADEQLEDVWRPENDSGRFYGPTRLREALVRSRNLVSIRVMQTIGIVTAIDYLSKLGFERTRLPRDLSLALGSASFSPLEMARAYAMLANGGFLIEPYFIDRIEDVDGQVIYQAQAPLACRGCDLKGEDATAGEIPPAAADEGNAEDEVEPETQDVTWDSADVGVLAEEENVAVGPPEARPVFAPQVMAPQVNYLITDMMRDVIRRGTGVRARALGREDIAGKTGTTNEYRDAWFSGFNPEVATTVWVGFDDFSSMGRGEYGGRAALPAWIDFMRVALDGLEEKLPPRPPGLVSVRIDPETGLLASAGNPDAIFETFIEGTLPERESESAVDDDNGDKRDDTSEADLF